MFVRLSTVACAAILILLQSCAESEDKYATETMSSADMKSETVYAPAAVEIEENADSGQDMYFSSSAARTNPEDTVRKFIRTADMKFRVKHVRSASLHIEDLTAAHGGFVSYSHLSSEKGYTQRIAVTGDSILESTPFTVRNQITLRVPHQKLDTVLRQIARLIVFLDHRTIHAQDVHLTLLKNRITRSRIAKHEERLEDAIDEQGNKLKETSRAEDKLLSRQLQADEAAFQNLTLQDQIEFSTVSLDIYQREVWFRELVANEKNIREWEPSFMQRVGEAMNTGWQILTGFFLVLVRSWSILLIIGIAFLVIRWVIRKLK